MATTVKWSTKSFNKLAGTYGRMDLPSLGIEDDFILYTDLDVVFNRDIRLTDFATLPKYFAAAPQLYKVTTYFFFISGYYSRKATTTTTILTFLSNTGQDFPTECGNHAHQHSKHEKGSSRIYELHLAEP